MRIRSWSLKQFFGVDLQVPNRARAELANTLNPRHYPEGKQQFGRGEFDPVKAFPYENYWEKYAEIPHEDLALWEKFDKWLVLNYRAALGYRRYGLLYDDLIYEERPWVQEAVARMPDHLRKARYTRQDRAKDLAFHQTHLPKEQWTKFEEDIPYLRPYIAWVAKDYDIHNIFENKQRH
eukprot:gb/GECH01011519.1/.p1 GENE.gb/GECH01011519.1/~~gb/GECH01011519.1/.p1  ORF type:complete len:179 (+),score=40.42 gb/GECH01011519.1/:1-537(+)